MGEPEYYVKVKKATGEVLGRCLKCPYNENFYNPSADEEVVIHTGNWPEKDNIAGNSLTNIECEFDKVNKKIKKKEIK
jgi:hypothetical protein